MKRSEQMKTGGCGTGVVVMLATIVVMLPIVGYLLLPQADIPGRIGWAFRRGTMGPNTSLIPNDDLTTGLLATIFLILNLAVAVIAGSRAGRSRKGSRGISGTPGSVLDRTGLRAGALRDARCWRVQRVRRRRSGRLREQDAVLSRHGPSLASGDGDTQAA